MSKPNKDITYFSQLLRDRDLRATTFRLKLLTCLQAYHSAMPHAAIQSAMEPIDRVTLYRTLDSLIQKGIIHKAYQEGSNIYYAICDENCDSSHHHEHLHFRCSVCETVTCQLPSHTLKISIPDYEVHKVDIHVDGVCKSCKRKS